MVFCFSGPNLVILAWTGDEWLCGQASDWYTHTDTGNDNTRRPKLASGNKNKSHYIDFHRKKSINMKLKRRDIFDIGNINLINFFVLSLIVTWKYHMPTISGIIARSVGMITKAKRYLIKNALVTLYYSFMYPYLHILIICGAVLTVWILDTYADCRRNCWCKYWYVSPWLCLNPGLTFHKSCCNLTGIITNNTPSFELLECPQAEKEITRLCYSSCPTIDPIIKFLHQGTPSPGHGDDALMMLWV